MLLKDKKTGEVIGRSYSAAYDLVNAGTHEFVNNPPDETEAPAGMGDLSGAPGRDDGVDAEAAPDLNGMTKAELEAEADRRGVTVPSGATKADIVALLNN